MSNKTSFKKGHIPWNINKKGIHLSSKSEFKKGQSRFCGKKHTTEAKKRMSIARLGRFSGKNHPGWKGGISKDKQHYIRERRVRKYNAEGFHTFGDWELLKAQYNYICSCCHKSEPEIQLTEDHIIPLLKGGSDNIENIQPLCRSCNSKKHTKIIKF